LPYGVCGLTRQQPSVRGPVASGEPNEEPVTAIASAYLLASPRRTGDLVDAIRSLGLDTELGLRFAWPRACRRRPGWGDVTTQRAQPTGQLGRVLDSEILVVAFAHTPLDASDQLGPRVGSAR
jgi:hypothetical protein